MTGLSPTLVGALRGVILAAVAGALAAASTAVAGLDLGAHGWAIPIVLAVLRTLEGELDRQRGQAPQAPLGSRPADPTAYLSTVILPEDLA